MGLVELFVEVLVVGFSLVNAGVPVAAWARGRDARFLLVAAGHGGLAVLGAVWAWGTLPYATPGFPTAQLPILVLVLLVVLAWFAATLWRPTH